MAADTEPANLLKTLRQERPRTILTKARLAEIKQLITTDADAKRAFESLKARGEKILKDDPIKHELIGPRLLTQSRNCLHRVTTCSMLFLLTDDKRFLDRAVLEMTTAAAFPDWNPSHFLDTAEMTAALGFGYDWLYPHLTEAQRKTIREAIVQHGLNEGMLCYEGKAKYGWWTKATHNWAQVCNGGLAVGALAIAKEEPELAEKILQNGLKVVRGAYAHWDKDGAWDEGPGYWGYTTQYTAYHMAVLETALGSDFDLPDGNGLHNAGQFRMHFIGPTGKTFNFADATESAGTPSQMFYLAKRFNRPEYAWHHRQERLDSAFDLIWFDPRGKSPDDMKIPTDMLFREANVAFMRSSWADPKATWLGIKGGDNGANHSHLDLGCFVLDAKGQRWAIDLGTDNYNLPGYFGKERWTYYRLNTNGQNTLVINGENQLPKAKAAVTQFDAGAKPAATIDLSAAYPMCEKVIRRATRDGTTITLTDEITAKKSVDVLWQMHTLAQITIKGNVATLTQGGQTLTVTLANATPGAAFETASAEQQAPQNPNKGINKLLVRAKGETVRYTLDFR